MKRHFLVLSTLMIVLNLFATDIIVLKNSTRIDAKILEVSDTEIKYKKASNLEGPTFIQRVEDISAIIYENGDVQSYSQPASSQGNTATTRTTQPNHSAKKESKIQFNPQPSDHYIVGLTLGYTSKSAVYTEKNDVEKISTVLGTPDKVSPAMRFGLTVNPTFKYGIGVRTGLYMEYVYEVVKDGAETSSGDITDFVAHDITFSLPAQLSYRYELIPNLSFVFYTGPVFDFGAFQSAGVKGGRMSENRYLYRNPYSRKDGYWGFNCLWGVGAGIQWSRLRFDIGGEFGLVNKYESSYSTNLKWNKPIYVSLTCFF